MQRRTVLMRAIVPALAGTPEEFAALIAAESKHWAALIKAKGIKVD